ncbi:MAG TPA: ATP-binding protein [Pyrinomonadaceae bacterium]|nr:ATP-binding protein [Pyrinomonadaceae bacterium]
MRSLFLKVFLWFWLATVLVIGALALTSYLTRPELAPRPPQFIEGIMTAYSLNAVGIYEHGGQPALDSFLQHMESEAHVRAHLFDAEGNELAGREATPEEKEMAARVVRTGGPASRMSGGVAIEARTEPARDGGSYAFVAALPLGPLPPGHAPSGQPRPFQHFLPPGPFNFLLGDTPAALGARLAAMILTAGLLCYMLARYIVSPVVKLREVTRQVARGDLSARVGPLLGRRRDELAAMGHDFDAMAARVETLVSAQARLLRDISHELRSPLARLTVALDLARKRAGEGAATHLDRIEREAKRLNEMIGQLLALSRWESDGGGMRLETVSLSELVREVAADADFEAQGKDCSVVVAECDECETRGTPALLRSAVENVLRNAVRYTPEGTAVKISLRCPREDGDGQALIAVRDEGAGVPEEALADIFRPFYRVDDSRTRETGGAGLGLSITERALRLHGGSVAASNVPGGGFVVELRLPLNHDAPSAH